eukprot:10181939-Karenia_brevis.AAC.1
MLWGEWWMHGYLQSNWFGATWGTQVYSGAQASKAWTDAWSVHFQADAWCCEHLAVAILIAYGHHAAPVLCQ